MENNKCPKCGGAVWMVEYDLMHPQHYDGVSEHACINTLESKTCDYRVGRWCGKQLASDECERRWCDGSEHPKNE